MRTLIPFNTRLPSSFDQLRREMDEVFGGFFGPTDADQALVGFAPQTNLAETENEFEVTLELPGLKPEDFNVELEGNELVVSGEREHETEEKGKTYHRVERRYGKFRRVVSLSSDVNQDAIDAEYKDGILSIKLPKAEAAKPKRIEVKG